MTNHRKGSSSIRKFDKSIWVTSIARAILLLHEASPDHILDPDGPHSGLDRPIAAPICESLIRISKKKFAAGYRFRLSKTFGTFCRLAEHKRIRGDANPLDGWVAEWSKAPVLKTGVGQPTVGSNPTPSASFFFSLRFPWLVIEPNTTICGVSLCRDQASCVVAVYWYCVVAVNWRFGQVM